MQLIVLGTRDSATALVTRVINIMGAYLANEHLHDNDPSHELSDNRPGNYLLKLSDELLSTVDARWDKIAGFDIQNLPSAAKTQFVQKVRNVILELDKNKPWVIDASCFSLILPLVRPLLETPICIHVNRSPIQIAQEFRDIYGFPIKFSIALWEKYTLSSLLGSSGLPKVFVPFEDIMRDPDKTINQLYTSISEYDVKGLHLPSKIKIRDDIHKYIEHVEKSDLVDHSFFNVSQKKLFDTIVSKKSRQLDTLPSVSMESIEIMYQFEDKVRIETNFKESCVDLAEMKENLNSKDQEIKSLHRKLQEMEILLTTKDQNITEAQKIIQTEKNEIGALTNEIDAQRNEIEEQKEENQELKNTLGSLDATLIENEQDIYQLKNHSSNLQEEILSLNDALKTSEKELERYKSDYEKIKTDLITKDESLQSTQKALESSVHKANLMQKENVKYKQMQSHTDTTLNSLKQQLKSLENSLNHEKHFVYKLTRWLRTLDNDINSLQKSKRWIIGNKVVRIIETFLLRKRVPIAMDHMEEILAEFREWESKDLKKKPIVKNTNH